MNTLYMFFCLLILSTEMVWSLYGINNVRQSCLTLTCMIYMIYQIRLPPVIGEPEWCLMTQKITNIPHSVLTRDINAHSTLWHSHTDDHRGPLIADVISNSDHITLNTNTPTRVPNTTLQQTLSPRCLNTLYNWTSWTTQHDYRLQQNRRTFTNHKKADGTQFTLSLRPPNPPIYTLPAEVLQTSY